MHRSEEGQGAFLTRETWQRKVADEALEIIHSSVMLVESTFSFLHAPP